MKAVFLVTVESKETITARDAQSYLREAIGKYGKKSYAKNDRLYPGLKVTGLSRVKQPGVKA